MNYFEEIRNKIIHNEMYQRAKDYSKEKHRVITYFEIVRILTNAGGKYGDNIIGEYACKLVKEFGTRYNKRTLFRMKQFYLTFFNKNVSTLSTHLTWSHYTELLTIKNQKELEYYLNISTIQKLNVRELREKIKYDEFKKTSEKYKNGLMKKEMVLITETIKNPIILHAKTNTNYKTEELLHRLIIEDLSTFLKELGNGFAYIADEYPIKLDDRYNYIDFLLYNYKYKCYVVVELKVTELKKEHIGQIKFYMNYIDQNEKSVEDNKTLGIIICAKNNELIIKYSSDENIVPVEYELV